MSLRTLWNKISTTASAAQSALRKDFPYTLNEEYGRSGVWTLHHGVRKADHQQVTIFSLTAMERSYAGGDVHVEMAQVNGRRLRAIRHPSIIAFVDFVEMSGDQIRIVTESVRPLKDVIREMKRDVESSNLSQSAFQSAVSWGLYSVIKALDFLHSKNLYLGMLPMHSIYVNEAGEWKIGDLSFLSELYPPGSAVPQQGGTNSYGFPLKRFCGQIENCYKSPELVSQKWDIVEQYPQAMDSWAIACLIYEVFEGELSRLNQFSQSTPARNVPRALLTQYKQLIHDNPTIRQHIPQVLESGYFDNTMIKTQLFLEEMTLKEPREIRAFVTSLSNTIDDLPKDNAKYKILPHLFNAIKYGTGESNAIAPMFKIGSMMEPNEYKKRFVPDVLELLDVESHTVKVILLKYFGQIVPHLSAKDVEKRVYPSVAKGFVNSDPALRAETLKAIVPLVPKLSEKVVSNEVVKFMWTLQTDREPGIRTNTIIAFGMLAPNFSEDVRKRIMLHAFARSLKDPYPHAKVAALKALNATKEYYTVTEVASKIIPVVSPLTIDKEQLVRETALQVLQLSLQFITEISKSPNFLDFVEQTKTTSAGGSKASNTADAWSWATKTMSSVKGKLLGDSLEMKPTLSTSTSTPSSATNTGRLSSLNNHDDTRRTCAQQQRKVKSSDGPSYGSASQIKATSKPADDDIDYFADMGRHPSKSPGYTAKRPQISPPKTQPDASSNSGWEADDLFAMEGDNAIDNFLDSVSADASASTTPIPTASSSKSSNDEFDPFAELDPFGDAPAPRKPINNNSNNNNRDPIIKPKEAVSDSYRQATDVFNLSSSRYNSQPKSNNNNHIETGGKARKSQASSGWEEWGEF